MTHINQIGTRPEFTRAKPIEFDMDALVRCYERMPAQRQREFWQMDVSRNEKILYLLKWGGLQVCN